MNERTGRASDPLSLARPPGRVALRALLVFAAACLAGPAPAAPTPDPGSTPREATGLAPQRFLPPARSGTLSVAEAEAPGAELELQDADAIERALAPKTRGFRPTAAQAGGRIDLRVEFDFDSARLTPRARTQLDQLAIAMRSEALAGASFQMVGHTDARGSSAYNKVLSLRRAKSARRYLHTRHGIASARLLPIGKGEEEPLLPTDPNDHRNRRVEIITLPNPPR